MAKFYFTYGLEGAYPGGWTEVEAPGYQAAVDAFKAYHPKRDGFLPYCSLLTEKQFEASGMVDGNLGHGCWERITVIREVCDADQS